MAKTAETKTSDTKTTPAKASPAPKAAKKAPKKPSDDLGGPAKELFERQGVSVTSQASIKVSIGHHKALKCSEPEMKAAMTAALVAAAADEGFVVDGAVAVDKSQDTGTITARARLTKP